MIETHTNWLPLLLLLAPTLAAVLLGLGEKRLSRGSAALIAGLGMLGGVICVLAMAPSVMAGDVARLRFDWLPQLGLAFSLRIDGLALMFAGLVCGIGLLIVLYAQYYLDSSEPVPRFLCYLMLFTTAMLGVVIAGNLLLLAVAWELTSLTSFLLIGYWREQSDARQGARIALAITGAGGLALFAGFLWLGHVAGSFELDVVFAEAERIKAHEDYRWILGLVLLGAFTKSAQFPFHFWLPHAMAAPTPVSAFLHSATMVKAGVFLLARMYPALAGTDEWFVAVSSIGLATLLLGAFIAIFQHDLKGLLAYSTISHLGLITLLLGLQTQLSVVAAVFHILNHATFKASLFMAAGIIDHESGSRDMRKLSGLIRLMPWTGTLAIVAAGAMAGVPLLNGFLSKEMFFAEALELGDRGMLGWIIPSGALLAAIFSVAYSWRFVLDVFFGPAPIGLPRTPHEPPRWMKVPVEVLVVLCVAVGLFPAALAGGIVHAAADATAGTNLPDYHLAIWHGFNLPLLMSAIALVGGVALYVALDRGIGLHRLEPKPHARRLYERKLAAMIGAAGRLTAGLEVGRLQRYLLLLVMTIIILGAWPVLSLGWPQPQVDATEAPALAWLLWGLLVAALGALMALYPKRLAALALLGVIGLIVSLAFVFLSAPDLALTQLLVEVASVLLLLLSLKYLPDESPAEAGRWRLYRDAGIAVVAGIGVAAFVYAVLSTPTRSGAEYYLREAVAGAGGTNVVNVILVDFRALDTLGEITVFAVAALVIHALLANYTIPGPHLPGRSEDKHPLLLRVVAGLILPLALLVGIYLLLRGHNQPGGGFIAGLMVAVAGLLQYVASGAGWVEARLKLHLTRMVAIGLALAGLTGVAAWLFDYPFLTSYYQYWKLPVVEKIPMASAFVFDLGVFLVVSAGTLLALSSLGRLENREDEV